MDDLDIQCALLKDLGLDGLAPKEQEEAITSIGRIIFQGVLIRVLEELDEKSKDEFDKLLDEKPSDQDAVFAFLKSKLPNFDEIVSEEVANFKHESVDIMKKLG